MVRRHNALFAKISANAPGSPTENQKQGNTASPSKISTEPRAARSLRRYSTVVRFSKINATSLVLLYPESSEAQATGARFDAKNRRLLRFTSIFALLFRVDFSAERSPLVFFPFFPSSTR